jgi:hypothetical protein
MRNFILSIIVGAFLISFLGCALTPIAGPIINSVVTWHNGEAHKYYDFNSEIIYRATKHTAEDMGLTIQTNESKENGEYYLLVGENDEFKIKIIPHESNITRLSIRVNFMGDKPYAELFYQNVDDRLGIIEFGPDGNPRRARRF